MRVKSTKLCLFTAFAALSGLANPAFAQYKTLDGKAPLVIGHRGASGLMPEHTLEAYKLAIEQGADFIEPDLVMTRDGVLIARHEPMLGDTTDVSTRPEFASKKVKRSVDGVEKEEWYVSDFTLAEIRQLRAKQQFTERDQSNNGKFLIPTFQEVIDLVKAESASRNRVIGVYPETKHPTYHAALGMPLEDKLLDVLKSAGWTEKTSPVFIQSFEVSNLKALRPKTQVRLVQLVDADDVDKDGNIVLAAPYDRPFDFVGKGDKRTFADLLTPEGLAEIKTYADGVGPWKPYLLPSRQTIGADGKPVDLNKDGKIDEQDRTLMAPTRIIENAHKAGLFVHTWTFRDEARRLASDFKGDPAAEYKAFFSLGIDGLFSDFPQTAVKARAAIGR